MMCKEYCGVESFWLEDSYSDDCCKNIIEIRKTEPYHPFEVVSMFEHNLALFTGSKYAIAVDNCTDALMLCCQYVGVKGKEINIPKKTYLSVPQSIMNAGGKVTFRDENWKGIYELEPTNIYDSAKRLRKGMYIPGSLMCLSFHQRKHLQCGKGGAILTNSQEAADWFKQARYEGRTPGLNYKDDDITFLGHNCYMDVVTAARALHLLHFHPDDAPDLPEEDDYCDLTQFSLFKDCEVVG